MIVEFKSVRGCAKKGFEKNQDQENPMGIPTTPPSFYNEKDYVTSVYLEMDTVVDFTVGRVFYNSNMHECVYANTGEGLSTHNLLILGTDFKKILEFTRNIKIKGADEILNTIRNENNTASI